MNYVVWQLVDSGFPAGGFAHSGGLEASVHHGYVHDAISLRAFARQTLAQTGSSALPLVTAAHRKRGDLSELDQLCDAFLLSPVANRASRAQGRALVTSTARSFHHVDLVSLEQQVREEQLAAHHAPIFGAVLSLVGVDQLETQRLFLFLSVRNLASAAVRLGMIGAYDAQGLQTDLSHEIDPIIARSAGLDPLDIAHTAPLIDLCQSTHDRLYSRLFQS